MKTVYDFFLEYYKSLQTDCSKINCEVEEGIAYYLKTLQIYDVFESAEEISKMELARFRLMNKETFETYFEKYEIIYKIETLVRESKILAINRNISGETISKELMNIKLTEFYDLISELAKIKKYASWIEYTTNDIIYFLKFASAEVDYLMPSIFS